jgi:hypothetical protein
MPDMTDRGTGHPPAGDRLAPGQGREGHRRRRSPAAAIAGYRALAPDVAAAAEAAAGAFAG